MKIAVSSASGGLGNATLKALLKRTSINNIIGIARTPSKVQNLGIEVRQGDFDKPETFKNALINCDAVLLVSSNAEPRHRIAQHRNVIEAAKYNGISKLVYTSILGNPEKTAFSPIIKSNRQTEQDIIDSGLNYSIGRNSLYIDPDLEYIEHYKKEGKISNCAGSGKCTYTSRAELGNAYAELLLSEDHENKIFNLGGKGITQEELAKELSQAYNTNLIFEDMSVEEYIEERKAALGDFLGTVIGGIYEGIRNGAFDVPSDFEKLVGRKHQSIQEMIEAYRAEHE